MPTLPDQPFTVLQSVGHTDLVQLEHLGCGLGARLLAKREAANPGGSIKDRVAVAMLAGALKKGRLSKEIGLVEPTSGNTGVGLAIACAHWQIPLALTMPESMSQERRALLKALGARLVLTPARLGMAGSIAEAERLVQQEGLHMLDQFTNPLVVEAHYTGTGAEIAGQVANIDVFVASVGTGGTLEGVGRRLRERWPAIRLYAVEPAESPVLSGGKAGPHGIQGIGPGFVPPLLDMTRLDGVITVSTQDALVMARRLATEEGLLAGISSGANVWAALSLAARPEYAGATIVTVLPDSGERYLSTELFA